MLFQAGAFIDCKVKFALQVKLNIPVAFKPTTLVYDLFYFIFLAKIILYYDISFIAVVKVLRRKSQKPF